MEQITNEEVVRWGVTTIIALLGSAVAFYALSLKLFIKIKSAFKESHSVVYSDAYISSVLLINEKDRTEPIFGIYLKCGRNIYVELKKFEVPLLIGPCETLRIELSPVSWYGLNGSKVSLNHFFSHLPYPKIILSTRKGKYTTKPINNHWNPIAESLKTHRAAAIQCIQLKSSVASENDPVISKEADYIVTYEMEGKEYIAQVFKSPEHQSANNNAFQLTKESLKNKRSLMSHLSSTIIQGRSGKRIKIKSVHNIDDELEISQMKRFYRKYRELPNWGFFKYHFLARLIAWLYRLKLKSSNFRIGAFSSFREKVYLSSLPYILMAVLVFIIVLSFINRDSP